MDEDFEPDFPPIGYGQHLVPLIFKFGEISFTEIKSWCEITRTPLTGWEAETMIQMRSAYDSMKQKATDKECEPPYVDYDNLERVSQVVDAQFDDLFGAIG